MQGRTLLLMIFLGCSAMGNAEVYRWVDKDGKVQFSDALPPEAVDQARTEINATSGMATRMAAAAIAGAVFRPKGSKM